MAINILVHDWKVCLQDSCADMEKVDYPRIIHYTVLVGPLNVASILDKMLPEVAEL